MKFLAISVVVVIIYITFAQGSNKNISLTDYNKKKLQLEKKFFQGGYKSYLDQYKYRGTHEDQISLIHAIELILFPKKHFLESKAFSSIKSQVTDTSLSNDFKFAKKSELKQLIKQSINNNSFQNIEDANLASKNILDKYFRGMDPSRVKSDFLNYSSGYYLDWSEEMVFTSFYQKIARAHGDRLIIIKELSTRGVDLNYYNYDQNNKSLSLNSRNDLSEYVIPGYVPGSDIVGYEILNSNKSSKLGFYRYVDKSIPYVLIVDLNDSSCTDFNVVSQKIFSCVDDSSYLPFEKQKLNILNSLSIIGVIEPRGSDIECALPLELANNSKYRFEKNKKFKIYINEIMKSANASGKFNLCL